MKGERMEKIKPESAGYSTSDFVYSSYLQRFSVNRILLQAFVADFCGKGIMIVPNQLERKPTG